MEGGAKGQNIAGGSECREGGRGSMKGMQRGVNRVRVGELLKFQEVGKGGKCEKGKSCGWRYEFELRLAG